MKYTIKLIVLLVFLCAAIWGCKRGEAAKSGSSGTGEENLNSDASYALGMSIGADMKEGDVRPNIEEFIKGFQDGVRGETTRYNMETARQMLNEAFTAMAEQRDASQKQAEVDFLAENSKKPGIVITGSGLQYEVISEGSGPKPAATDMVEVNYKGTFTDGTEFDSSYSRGEPARFPLNGVIPGWTEGIQLMNVGSKYKFYIPSELGYGPQGGGPIPPYSLLIFEVELLSIVNENAN